jgi:hypothetical protein
MNLHFGCGKAAFSLVRLLYGHPGKMARELLGS